MPDAMEQIRQILDPILKSMGLDLWDMEFQKQGPKGLLRIYIDREIGGGITLGDCEKVSRDLGAALDVGDVIQHAYTLEVSSPGLDRSLTKPEHYIRFEGSLVRIKTYQPVSGQKVFRGKLRGLAGPLVIVELESGETMHIPLEGIAKTSLEVEF